MRAWLLERPAEVALSGQTRGPLVLRDVQTPQPGPGEVRLRVDACGVCHTDLHTAEGDLDLPRLPIIPGHQVVGTVDAVGEGVTDVSAGMRVGAYWLRKACGVCPACLRGEENLCEQAEFNGLHRHGGYAEWMTVPAAYTVPIPDRMESHAAAPLLCAGVIGYRSLRLADFQPGRRVALFGFGASAHLVLQLALRQEAEVFVFTRGASHRRLALELGARWAGMPGDDAPSLADSAVTFAPAGSVVPQALRAVRPGGTVAINAVHMTDIPAMPYTLLYGERTLRSVANLTAQDAREFIALADRLDIRAEFTTYPFATANEALRDMKASQLDGAAVLDVRHD